MLNTPPAVQVMMVAVNLPKTMFEIIDVRTPTCERLRGREILSFFEKLPPSRVSIQSCATASYWAKQIAALGHDVNVLPPASLKGFLPPVPAKVIRR